MSIEKVRAYFEKEGIAHRIMEFDVSSATVELAAAALGTEGGRIAKTLSFSVLGEPVLIVCAGDARIDNAKFKAKFKTKAKMLTPDEVESMIGHRIGGVCPFGINDGVKVYLDVSMRRFEYIYPAAGSSNSAIKLSMEELERVSEAQAWIDVCKLPE